jgi:hypothetical protein
MIPTAPRGWTNEWFGPQISTSATTWVPAEILFGCCDKVGFNQNPFRDGCFYSDSAGIKQRCYVNHINRHDRTPKDQWSKLLFWGHFIGSDRSGKIVRPGCGWAHYLPNGERGYDWANPKHVETDMDDWKPDGSGQKTRLNCQRWGRNSLRWL